MQLSVLVREIDLSACGELSAVIDNAGRIPAQTEVPAASPESCGNWLLHDLPMCLWESRRYLDRLEHHFHCEYAKLHITLDDGKVFADA